jgi:hypothetical protein
VATIKAVAAAAGQAAKVLHAAAPTFLRETVVTLALVVVAVQVDHRLLAVAGAKHSKTALVLCSIDDFGLFQHV